MTWKCLDRKCGKELTNHIDDVMMKTTHTRSMKWMTLFELYLMVAGEFEEEELDVGTGVCWEDHLLKHLQNN